MASIKDLKSGDRFSRLTAVRYVEHRSNNAYWEFKCDCGNVKTCGARKVVIGHTTSCGCFHKEMMSAKAIVKNMKHSKSKTKEYSSWVQMKDRCHNLKSDNYEHYGAKGITVCDCWLNSFENFLEDMGLAPSPKHSIDRIDGTLGYFPENCRWADNFVQNNNRSISVKYSYMGKELSLPEWARELNLSPAAIAKRVQSYGWTIERALETPVEKRKNRPPNLPLSSQNSPVRSPESPAQP